MIYDTQISRLPSLYYDMESENVKILSKNLSFSVENREDMRREKVGEDMEVFVIIYG